MLRFRLMVQRGPRVRPQASEGEAQHDAAFLAVARARSFTKAAAQLGVSPSAMSHKIRSLEERLGLRVPTRTTRRVEPTEAGGRLLRALGPRFDEIEAEVAALSELRDKPLAPSASRQASTQLTPFSGRSSRSSCRTIRKSKWKSSSTTV